MNEFQLILSIITIFFIYKAYEFVQNIDDKNINNNKKKPVNRIDRHIRIDPDRIIDDADEAYKNNDLDKALNLLEIANRNRPNSTEIINKLAFILSEHGEIKRAIEQYNGSITLNENDDLVHNAIASLYRKIKDFQKAEFHYQEALRIDSNYEVTYYNYGNLLLDMQKTQDAQKMYQKAVEINPDFTEAKTLINELRDSMKNS